jgi:BirA family biotin operon repressor/biotin-[acetyl-CoA-carboxylase] ligase
VKWILVGDDGQHDEEIYGEFQTEHEGNVEAIAIRQLSNSEAVLAGGRSKAEQRTDVVRWVYSPDGAGLYMSLIVRRDMPISHATRLTTAAAVAVAQAIEQVSGRKARIKWVNDIYLDGKKACGILTEGGICSEGGRLEYAVIGIGVNVAPPAGGFPSDISDIATAVFDRAGAALGAREALAAEILNRLMPMLDNITSLDILNEYRRRSLIQEQCVLVHRAGVPPRAAYAIGVDEEFRLLVRYEDGTTEALDSGEVSVRAQ